MQVHRPIKGRLRRHYRGSRGSDLSFGGLGGQIVDHRRCYAKRCLNRLHLHSYPGGLRSYPGGLLNGHLQLADLSLQVIELSLQAIDLHAPCLLGRHPAETANDDIPIERLSAALAGAVVDEEGLDAGGLHPNAKPRQLCHPRQPRVYPWASSPRWSGWSGTACFSATRLPEEFVIPESPRYLVSVFTARLGLDAI